MSEPSSRRSASLIVLVALAWLVAAAAVVIAAASDMGPLDGPALARFAAGLTLRLAPPLAVVIVGVELLRRSRRDDGLAELEARTAAAAAAGEAVRDGLLDIDATLTAIGGRLADLRAATVTEAPQLIEAARGVEAMTARLAATTDTTAAAARDLAAVVPRAQADAEALAATLAATGATAAHQLGEVETMLAGVATRQDEIAATVTAIGVASEAAAGTIEARTATLAAATDAALAQAAAALDAARTAVDEQAATTRTGIEGQQRAMLATIDAARTGIDAIAGPATAAVARRIEQITVATQTLSDALAEHEARTNAMTAGMERSFAVLDKRLGHAATMGTATLDGFQARLTAVRELADAVPPQLEAATAGFGAVEAAAARLGPAAASASEIAAALARAAAPAERLVADLTTAQAALAAVEQAAHGTTLAAANQLIEVLGRVREVAATATGNVRDALAGVVAEAEAALAEAGTRTAAQAFADPIRHEIAGLEGAAALAGEAAQATADRLTARLMGLTEVVATVEKRLAQVG